MATWQSSLQYNNFKFWLTFKICYISNNQNVATWIFWIKMLIVGTAVKSSDVKTNIIGS